MLSSSVPQREAMGRLTTHVLDTAHGRPAAGMRIELFRWEGERRIGVKTAWTQADGRCRAPLLDEAEFQTGEWELVFHVGEYFARTLSELPRPAFLNLVPVRCGFAEEAHYHVPLLTSPWSYTTYRGS